jgi:SAM-dependent methyltransferase
MKTDYDAISAEYKAAKQQPWRYCIERYTLLQLLGDLQGLSVLDLACGEGFYTRELRHRGAARVVGLDLSEGMIRMARDEEAREPLGIEYRAADARTLDAAEQFDLVMAAYLLNYAATQAELREMCAAIARALKPGGRFVGVNNNPQQRPEHYGATSKYGFVKCAGSSAEGELREGAPVIYTILLENGPLEITNYYLSTQAHEEAFRAAGFAEVRWHSPRVSPAGRIAFGEDYWDEFLADPPVILLEAVRYQPPP